MTPTGVSRRMRFWSRFWFTIATSWTSCRRRIRRERRRTLHAVPFGRPFDYRLPDTPTKYRNKHHTFLAHISKGREDGSVGWPTDEMMFEMEGAFVRFLDELSETDRDLFLDPDYSDPLALPPEVFSSGW